MTELSKFQAARLQREYDECRTNAVRLVKLAGDVRYIMERPSTPIYECPDLDEAYNRLIACACNMAEYR